MIRVQRIQAMCLLVVFAGGVASCGTAEAKTFALKEVVVVVDKLGAPHQQEEISAMKYDVLAVASTAAKRGATVEVLTMDERSGGEPIATVNFAPNKSHEGNDSAESGDRERANTAFVKGVDNVMAQPAQPGTDVVLGFERAARRLAMANQGSSACVVIASDAMQSVGVSLYDMPMTQAQVDASLDQLAQQGRIPNLGGAMVIMTGPMRVSGTVSTERAAFVERWWQAFVARAQGHIPGGGYGAEPRTGDLEEIISHAEQ